MKKISTSGIHATGFSRILERAAGWHSPLLLQRAVPAVIRGGIRELKSRILTVYVVRKLPREQEFDQSAEDALASGCLSIVLPIHDAPEVTRRCLTSLQKYAPNAEIILVDDGSRLEETIELIEDFANRNHWKRVRHLEALGHSAACGAGASLATRPYLCLLNSDTVVTPWCWRPLVQTFEEHSEIGVAGPSTSYGEGQALPLANLARHSLNDSQICAYARCLLGESSGTTLTELHSVIGFAFLIRRSLWEQLGGFDRDFPDYGNEVELCRRVVKAGYRLVWVRHSYIHHFGAKSYGKILGKKGVDARRTSGAERVKQKYPSDDF